MAFRNIVQVGDQVLRKKSFPVSEFGEKINQLLDDMKDTLIRSGGAGLAAPQVGVLRRVFIVNVEEENFYCEFINPSILKTYGTIVGPEGCLSVPLKRGRVPRPQKVVIKAQDRNGKTFTLTVKDFLAKAVCHEYDHLDGILFTDKAVEIWEE